MGVRSRGKFLLKGGEVGVELVEFLAACPAPLRQHLQHHVVVSVLLPDHIEGQQFRLVLHCGFRSGEVLLVLLQKFRQHLVLVVELLEVDVAGHEGDLEALQEGSAGYFFVAVDRQEVDEVVVDVLPDLGLGEFLAGGFLPALQFSLQLLVALFQEAVVEAQFLVFALQTLDFFAEFVQSLLAFGFELRQFPLQILLLFVESLLLIFQFADFSFVLAVIVLAGGRHHLGSFFDFVGLFLLLSGFLGLQLQNIAPQFGEGRQLEVLQFAADQFLHPRQSPEILQFPPAELPDFGPALSKSQRVERTQSAEKVRVLKHGHLALEQPSGPQLIKIIPDLDLLQLITDNGDKGGGLEPEGLPQTVTLLLASGVVVDAVAEEGGEGSLEIVPAFASLQEVQFVQQEGTVLLLDLEVPAQFGEGSGQRLPGVVLQQQRNQVQGALPLP